MSFKFAGIVGPEATACKLGPAASGEPEDDSIKIAAFGPSG
jgi:hypothetical protein